MKAWAKVGVVVLLAGVVAGAAWADRGHRHYPRSSVYFGINVGPPWVIGPYYPYWPRVYAPPVIIAPPPPPTIYIEQAPPPVAVVPTLEPGYWYYCREAGAYYPHVRQCSGDWHKVPPQLPR